ncbi:MAG: peptidoglycan editing factor PgeF [Armatimonadetes bacterium]|nr:peptidoglycan editing factor PgeF [Armatimonadota bacterium]
MSTSTLSPMDLPGHVLREQNGLRWIEPDGSLGGIARVLFTTRGGGHSRPPYDSLNLALHVDDVSERVRMNRRAVQAVFGPRVRPPVVMDQVHGARVAVVGEIHAGTRWEAPESALAGTDALVTATLRLPLTVLVADCVPVAIADPKSFRGVLAVAHAGWRGLAEGILGATVARLQETYGTDAADCCAWLGPAIGPCCYTVGAEVAAHFPDDARDGPGGEWRLDIGGAAARQLAAAGLQPERITHLSLCTACRGDLFFSHRRATQAGDPATGRQALFAWIIPPPAPG